jgi:ribosomal protein L11 methylase PrmA
MAQANRAFLRRAVRYCLANGVRQFLDIGSGIPTLGNVHEVAHQADPEARVVYVDIDPVAVEHSRALLLGNDRAAVVHEDLRNPEAILHSAEVRALIDFDRPVALLLVAVLHFMPDEDGPHGIIKRFADAMAPGSLLVLSHGAKDAREDVAETATELYVQTRTPGVPRGRAEVERFFESFPPVEPGVVWAPLWRPDSTPRPGDDPARSCIYVGVGRKA